MDTDRARRTGYNLTKSASIYLPEALTRRNSWKINSFSWIQMFTFVVLCFFNLSNLITLKIVFPDHFQIFYSDCFPGFPYSRSCLFWAENLTFQLNKNLHISLDFSVNIVSSLGSFCNITFPFPTFPISTKTHYFFRPWPNPSHELFILALQCCFINYSLLSYLPLQ